MSNTIDTMIDPNDSVLLLIDPGLTQGTFERTGA